MPRNTTCQCQLCWAEGVAENTNTFGASHFPPGWRKIDARLACEECFKSYLAWIQSRLALAPRTT